MIKKYIVHLTAEERAYLERLKCSEELTAEGAIHAQILLNADRDQPNGSCSDRAIAIALDVGLRTVERVRRRFAEGGLAAALMRKPGGGRQRRLSDEQKSLLLNLTFSEPPVGHPRWTLRLLAEQMVQLGYVETVSYETIRQTLRKMDCSLLKKQRRRTS